MLRLLGAALRGEEVNWRWEECSTTLPVAVGHGILSLLLLEELRDGQQLF